MIQWFSSLLLHGLWSGPVILNFFIFWILSEDEKISYNFYCYNNIAYTKNK